MVMVVSIHVPIEQYVEGGNIAAFPVAHFLFDMTAQGVARIAVPFFFFISGYLFFLKTAWGFDAYVSKIKKRFFTLVVPLVAWCGIAMLYTYLAWLGGWTYSIDFSALDVRGFFELYLGLDGSTRIINLPFWFVRDLFVVGLFSPLWFLLLRKCGICGVLFLGICLTILKSSFEFQVPYMPPDAIFFFCLGGYFSISGKDFVGACSRLKLAAAGIWPAALLFTHFFGKSPAVPYVHKIGILAGMVLVVALGAGFLSRNTTFRMPKVIEEATVLRARRAYVFRAVPARDSTRTCA